MAEALVSVVLEQSLSLIKNEIVGEVKLVAGVRKEVQKLSDTLTVIQRLLKDAEEKRVSNPAVKIWLEKLEDISYDADDVLDEWNTRSLMLEIQRSVADAPLRKKVCFYLFYPFSCFKPLSVRHDIAHRIKEIRELLDEVSREKDQYSFVENQTSREEARRPMTSSVVDVSEIYGRDDSKREIVSKLLSESSVRGSNVQVISIVGTGGFGKTALAQVILKEDKVKDHFEKMMWVCVSQPFDLERVAKEIIEQANGFVPITGGWDALHKNLCDAVKGKLFLLVLDDIWSFDDKIWNPLRISLNGGSPGSRILVTTRDERLGKLMGSTSIHRLEQLSDEDCWSLFRHVAFRDRQDDIEALEDVGKRIASKCKGVPLAARVLASLMCLQRSKEDWMEVCTSDLWIVMSKNENGFLPELWLSYYALPSHLKRCFMYCAIMRKDVLMEKDEMVKLWIAQGFIGTDRTRRLEKIGADYFDDLAMRSFFQDFVKDADGKIIGCKMHDLMHDFAQFLTKSESVLSDMNDQEFSCVQGRHLSASHLGGASISKLSKLRTLRPFDVKWKGTMPLDLFHQFPCLRALDLSGFDSLKELPAEVENLLHLRYLDLSGTKLIVLPETICSLLNLQTLKLNGCRNLRELPEAIGELSNLRHLEIGRTGNLKYLPQSISRLFSLRTLCKFFVRAESGSGKFEELKHLNCLEGSLQIQGLDQVRHASESAEAELKMKQNIRSLGMLFISGYREDDVEFLHYSNPSDHVREEDMDLVLEGLQPHPHLEKLDISFFPGSKLPFWISMLPNLVTLTLFRCEGCSQLPCLGKLESLEVLQLVRVSSVRQIGLEFYGLDTGNDIMDGDNVAFPRLRILEVDQMTNLQNWELPFSKNKKVMPRLCNLTLQHCESLRSLPDLGKLESLETMAISELSLGEHVSHEFLGMPNGDGRFPKLKEISVTCIQKREFWDMPFGREGGDIFPVLRKLRIDSCRNLKELTGLGKLKSLEDLSLCRLDSIEHLGLEFLGCPSDSAKREDSGKDGVLFPKLQRLAISLMHGWKEWLLPIQNGTDIFPNLVDLWLTECTSLRVLPALGRLNSLETLHLDKLCCVENVDRDLLGFSDSNEFASGTAIFPKLKTLHVKRMDEWEESNLPFHDKSGKETITTIMPCLHKLEITFCSKLKVVPYYMFCNELRSLKIEGCPELRGVQPCLPPLLEELQLIGDLGVISESLPISTSPGAHYPYLRYLNIDLNLDPRHSSLPKGFDQLTAIQRLEISGCKDFMPQELKHLTTLQYVAINSRDMLTNCANGANWVGLSHIPHVSILYIINRDGTLSV